MADRIFYLTGTINWAKVTKPDDMYNNYTIDLVLDEEGLQKFKDTGLNLKLRDTEDGQFIKLRRPVSRTVKGEVRDMGPPKVFLVTEKDGEEVYEPYDKLIGNGSVGIAKIRTYDTNRGKGHELISVAVTDLVKYEEAEGEGEFPF